MSKAENHWIQGAHLKKEASTNAAKREGVSLGSWIQEHKGDAGTAGRRARLAETFRKMAK